MRYTTLFLPYRKAPSVGFADTSPKRGGEEVAHDYADTSKWEAKALHLPVMPSLPSMYGKDFARETPSLPPIGGSGF